MSYMCIGTLATLHAAGGLVALDLPSTRPSRDIRRARAAVARASDDARYANQLAKVWQRAATFAVCTAGLFCAPQPSRQGSAGLQESGQSNPVSRRISPAPAWATEESVAAPSRTLNAAQIKRLKLMFKAKLAKVPVFMVTNDGGSPFLNQLATGDQSALMFINPAEAQRMLSGVLKAPNGAASGAKVLPTNLDRAFRLARLQPMPSGLRDQVTNRELTMVWQFMPHAAEQRAAQMLLAKSGKTKLAPSMPAYMVEGLVVMKRGKEVRPVFLAKSDCDAALAAVEAAGGNEDGSAGKVIVYDALALLLQLATAIEAGDPEVAREIESLEFMPSSESVDFREELKAGKAKRPAKIVPPQHHQY